MKLDASLYPRQQAFSYVTRDTYLIAPTGAGKTRAASAQAVNLINVGIVDRVLIVAPNPVSIDDWARELARADGLRVFKCVGQTPVNPTDVHVVLIHKALVGFWGSTLEAWVTDGSCHFIVDEVHTYVEHRRWLKVPGSDPLKPDFKPRNNRSYWMAQWSRGAVVRTGVTATLMSPKPHKMWNALDLVKPRLFGKYYDFARRYSGMIMQGGRPVFREGGMNLAELKQRIHEHLFLIEPKDVPEGMTVNRSTVIIPADQWSKRGVAHTKEDIRVLKFGSPNQKREVHLAHAARASERVMWEWIESSPDKKVLVWTGRIQHTTNLFKKAQKRKRLGAMTIDQHHGDMTPGERETVKKRAMRLKEGHLLFATYQSAGISGDWLKDYDLVLVVQLPSDPKAVKQMLGRQGRLGQDRATLQVFLIPQGTMAERIQHQLMDDLEVTDKLLESKLNKELTYDLDDGTDPFAYFKRPTTTDRPFNPDLSGTWA